MNSKQFLESTTSGSVATVATPVGKTQTRGKGIYPNEKGGNLLTGKKTNKKFANSKSVKESQEQSVSEAKLDEEDIIIVPGQGNRHKPGFIPKAKDRTDHEVEMAKSDLFQSAKNAKKVYELIKDIPETVGIEGWVQEKIIKANDYLNTVREYLEHKQLSEDTIEGKKDNFTIDDIKQLEKIKDLETIKARARELIKGFPDRRMKPEKIDYFYNRIDSLFSPMQVIKLMYDLLLAGEGMKTIGSRYSTSANSYQRRFDEMTGGVIAGGGVGEDVAEGYRILPNIDREKYQERQGLEGPFRARNGKVYYYDPKAGLAYDPDTDMYIDYDDLKMMDQDTVEEGIVGKVLGGAALIASLWGIGQNQAQQVYDNSPQLQTLIKYHQMATQQGDEAKLKEIERRIGNHKTRLSLGKGEVMGSDDKPIVPKYESSIMKGIQNEQSDDDYYGWSTKSTPMRDKMKHELGHETNNYAVMINGKTWKVFADKRQADNVARSLVNKGKDAYVSLTGASITEVAKSSFRQSSEDQASRYVDKIKSSNISDWEKEYLILVNDPKGSVFRAAYHSFPKGQEARKLVVNYIANKYNVSTDEIENLDMRELAKDLMESKCPDCGGKLVAENELTEENKDACYYKVKSRYKVWPSAYASGSLVQCRKKGASNWGNKSK